MSDMSRLMPEIAERHARGRLNGSDVGVLFEQLGLLESVNARLTAALAAAEARVAALRQALGVYADIRQYNGVAGHPDQTPPITFDRGARARNALAAAAPDTGGID